MKKMNETIFEKLMANAKCWSANLKEMYFTATFGNFFTEFGAYRDEENKLLIFEFGKLEGKKIVDLDPTDPQKSTMQMMIYSKAREMDEKYRMEELLYRKEIKIT